MASPCIQRNLAWTVHPARQSPGAALLAAAVIVALAVAVAVLMETVWWGVFSIVLLVLPLHRFFLPNRFVLDDNGASAGTIIRRRRIRWSEVRRCDHGPAGVRLSSRLRPAAIAGGASVILLFRDNADEVVARIESHLRETSSDVVAAVEVHRAPPV